MHCSRPQRESQVCKIQGFSMNDLRPDTPWDISLAELNSHLRLAGVEPVTPDEAGTLSALDLDAPTRAALATVLRESVRHARQASPPVKDWLAASEALVLNDDGSEAAGKKADLFWSRLAQIVHGSLALTELGDLSESPFFIELLRDQPAGHLTELAADVMRHYVDPCRELDVPDLIRRAEEWWRARIQTLKASGEPSVHTTSKVLPER
jgi:hypothetical protein